MARNLSTAMLDGLASPVLKIIILAEMHFDDGIFRAWTGIGDLVWAGETWIGTGDFGKVSMIEDAAGMQSGSLRVQLSGLRFENLAVALDQVTQGSPGEFFMGLLDENDQVIPEPKSSFYGPMGAPDVIIAGDKTVITLEFQGPADRFKEMKERRRTHEDQQIHHPGDLGLEYIAGMQGAEIVWK